MPQIAFNDANIAAIRATKTTWYTDSSKRAVRGLRLMAGARSKTWYLNKREGAKVRQVKLGPFPELNVEKARRRARDMINAVEEGTLQSRIDNDTRTLTEALDGYIERNMSSGSLSERTAQDYRDVIRVHASDWTNLPLTRITTREVERRFIDLEDHVAVGNKLIRVVRQVYKYAMAHDDALRDPTRVIQRLRPEPRREPIAHDLAVVMKDILNVENPVRRTAWQLLLHTGIRSSNLRSLTWGDVDLDARTVHLARMKNGESRMLPLSDASVALFESVRRYDDRWCLPSFKRPGPLDHLDALPHARQHDMRHHFTTAAALCQIPEYAIAFLRGDRVTTTAQAMAGYMHQIADHSTVNLISEHILEKTAC